VPGSLAAGIEMLPCPVGQTNVSAIQLQPSACALDSPSSDALNTMSPVSAAIFLGYFEVEYMMGVYLIISMLSSPQLARFTQVKTPATRCDRGFLME
jgi:hypothetical protein